MVDPNVILTELSTYASAFGISVTPTVLGAVRIWLRRDVSRNVLNAVHDALRAERPAPGDAKSMEAIYRSLLLQLVDPAFRILLDDLLISADASAIDRLSDHLTTHMSLPDGSDRETIVGLIVTTLRLSAGRAQRDVKAAVDIAGALNADRVFHGMADLLAEERRANLSAARRSHIVRLAEPILARHGRFGGRTTQLEALERFVTGADYSYALVTGISGFGKTALLAHFIRRLQRQGVQVAYHFISRVDGLAGEHVALRSLCSQLLAWGTVDDALLPTDVYELRALLPQLLEEVPHDPRLCCGDHRRA